MRCPSSHACHRLILVCVCVFPFQSPDDACSRLSLCADLLQPDHVPRDVLGGNQHVRSRRTDPAAARSRPPLVRELCERFVLCSPACRPQDDAAYRADLQSESHVHVFQSLPAHTRQSVEDVHLEKATGDNRGRRELQPDRRRRKPGVVSSESVRPRANLRRHLHLGHIEGQRLTRYALFLRCLGQRARATIAAERMRHDGTESPLLQIGIEFKISHVSFDSQNRYVTTKVILLPNKIKFDDQRFDA